MNSRTFVSILLLIIISGGIGYIYGKSSNNNSLEITSLKNENAKLSSQIEKAKAAFPPAPEMRFILGKVTAIGTNSLAIEVNQSQISGAQVGIFEDFPKTRNVLINSDTKIIKYGQKTKEELQNEIEMSKKQTANTNVSNEIIPSPYKEIAITLSQIPAGSTVIVDGGKDVKELSEFTAVKITLQEN